MKDYVLLSFQEPTKVSIMATVKVKFRASSVPGKEGTLYYHLIQSQIDWKMKQMQCIGTRNNYANAAKRAITVKDIRKIEKLDLPRGSSLDKTRDLFLLSFYLRGMAFVDMAFLKTTDLKCGLVSYNRRKTHQNINIEWMKPMQAIIDKSER